MTPRQAYLWLEGDAGDWSLLLLTLVMILIVGGLLIVLCVYLIGRVYREKPIKFGIVVLACGLVGFYQLVSFYNEEQFNAYTAMSKIQLIGQGQFNFDNGFYESYDLYGPQGLYLDDLMVTDIPDYFDKTVFPLRQVTRYRIKTPMDFYTSAETPPLTGVLPD